MSGTGTRVRPPAACGAVEVKTLDRLLTMKEAAAALSVSVRYLERLIVKGELQVVHIGMRSIRITEAELTRLIEKGATGR